MLDGNEEKNHAGDRKDMAPPFPASARERRLMLHLHNGSRQAATQRGVGRNTAVMFS
ncbi:MULTISPECIES: hypothetical protein [unclassified Herbaspirillum]|uniref:hypothetical protein n=1 Tax=unclassified Herbaspirillum TaxID=2624150 RepID=UPI001607A25C|nr:MULTISPECIES: hypothetical protein [unclassified Herbaspirillum]MBB5392521.1 hypothetical protein [Herbaspirillum sp. SJZ102]